MNILPFIETCYATTTEISLPSAGDTLGGILDWLNPFLTGFWDLILMLFGLGVVFWIIGRLTSKF